jgi:LPXTG-motif cell wall-anchored protein
MNSGVVVGVAFLVALALYLMRRRSRVNKD